MAFYIHYLTLGNKVISEASVLFKEDVYKLEDGNNGHQRLAAIFAASLISFGIVAFTITIIIAIVFYYKNVKERKLIQDVENGLNMDLNSHPSVRKARKGPNGVRLLVKIQSNCYTVFCNGFSKQHP